ncbi:hypothetical protein MHK_000198 [Candidatus Magnetomorum sp. HK-1]|nr:hypothetical protein MHK_000198 [Candidatus Magnetomorum sp. HK-1]
MDKKLIELSDGILVEVEVEKNKAKEIAGSSSEKVNASIDNIYLILKKISKPVINVWNEFNKEVNIEQTEIELGLSFEGEGNLFITKTKAGANIGIKFILKQKGL